MTAGENSTPLNAGGHQPQHRQAWQRRERRLNWARAQGVGQAKLVAGRSAQRIGCHELDQCRVARRVPPALPIGAVTLALAIWQHDNAVLSHKRTI